jgi:hypothetical protein
MQLVPQCAGIIDEALAESLASSYPQTQFRLHANVRVLGDHRLADLSRFGQQLDWFVRAAQIHRVLGAPAYSSHAGRRVNASLQTVFGNARQAADLFGSPVAIEGLYPDRRDTWLLSTWAEYAALLDAGVPYALDLSHLNILAYRTQRWETGLVQELVDNPLCIEIHESGNDGHWDDHGQIEGELDNVWWAPMLAHVREDCVVFTESIHREPKIA